MLAPLARCRPSLPAPPPAVPATGPMPGPALALGSHAPLAGAGLMRYIAMQQSPFFCIGAVRPEQPWS